MADCEGGVRDGVSCVSDSFAHQCHVRHSGKVGHFVLQGSLKHCSLGL